MDALYPSHFLHGLLGSTSILSEDYTSENGATLCVPGTHKWLRKPTKEDIEQTADQLATLSAPKGSIVIWHGQASKRA